MNMRNVNTYILLPIYMYCKNHLNQMSNLPVDRIEHLTWEDDLPYEAFWLIETEAIERPIYTIDLKFVQMFIRRFSLVRNYDVINTRSQDHNVQLLRHMLYDVTSWSTAQSIYDVIINVEVCTLHSDLCFYQYNTYIVEYAI